MQNNNNNKTFSYLLSSFHATCIVASDLQSRELGSMKNSEGESEVIPELFSDICSGTMLELFQTISQRRDTLMYPLPVS